MIVVIIILTFHVLISLSGKNYEIPEKEIDVFFKACNELNREIRRCASNDIMISCVKPKISILRKKFKNKVPPAVLIRELQAMHSQILNKQYENKI